MLQLSPHGFHTSITEKQPPASFDTLEGICECIVHFEQFLLNQERMIPILYDGVSVFTLEMQRFGENSSRGLLNVCRV